MIGNDFTGVGKYGDAYIVKAKPIHAETLQHQLRPTDARECMIAGVTPWRALMSPFGSGYLGFMIMPKVIKQNGYDVLRFVRCQETEYVNMYEDKQPGIS